MGLQQELTLVAAASYAQHQASEPPQRLYEPLKAPRQDGRETDIITDIITIKAK